MDEFSKEVFKEERKDVIKFFTKLPKFIKWILFFIWTAASFITGMKFDNLHLNLSNINQKGIANINLGSVEGDSTINLTTKGSSCPVKFCSDFKDGAWKYIERFIRLQEDPLILKSPHSSALPGATLFYNEAVGNFSSETFLTPQATSSANLVVAYGHFVRCIIGDGDYTKISCQINEAYPKEIESWSYFDKDGRLHGRNEQHQLSPFSPNKELQIQFSMQKTNNFTTLAIKLNDHVPLEWLLPRSFEDCTKIEKVGIGLFTTMFDDVQAVFKQFQLDPHI